MIKTTIATALVATGLMLTPAQADAVKLGTLTCNINKNTGYIIGSSAKGECVFKHNGKSQRYKAEFSRIGVDIGVTGNKTIVWAVVGISGSTPKTLKGSYTGVNVEATAIVGVGANALIGGMENGIVLNPVSVSGQTGLNIAAGVANLRLK